MVEAAVAPRLIDTAGVPMVTGGTLGPAFEVVAIVCVAAMVCVASNTWPSSSLFLRGSPIPLGLVLARRMGCLIVVGAAFGREGRALRLGC